jgi:hypothetical protein
MTMETKTTCLIVNADELKRLIRENIALKKELLKNEFACIPCDFCKSSTESVDACTGDCRKCGIECRCRDCGTENVNFEWRGIVPETEPTPEEEAELKNRLTARGRGHTHD